MPAAITAMNAPTVIVNAGYWKSWFDCSKPFTELSSTPSTPQKPTTPAVIAAPRTNVRRRSPPAAPASPMILSGTTGSTHGVKLRMAPPTNASSSMIGKNVPDSGSSSKSHPKSGTRIGAARAAPAADGPLAPSVAAPSAEASNPPNTAGSAATSPASARTSSASFTGMVEGARHVSVHAWTVTSNASSTRPEADADTATGT